MKTSILLILVISLALFVACGSTTQGDATRYLEEPQPERLPSSIPEPVIKKPDLVIDDLFPSNTTMVAGNTYRVYVDVKNIKSPTAGASVTMFHTKDPYNVVNGNGKNTPAIAGGQTERLEFNFKPLEPGNYTLWATADVRDEVDEANEDNNRNFPGEVFLVTGEDLDLRTCIDSDGGAFYQTYGYINTTNQTGGFNQEWDRCASPYRLIEQVCDSGNRVGMISPYNCVCEEGVCVELA